MTSHNINTAGRLSKVGLGLIAATGGIGIAISIVCIPFVSPAFRKICLPYVPATNQQVLNILRVLKGRSGSLIDLGSGDGRIVLAAAKVGFKAHGIELNPWLVWYSRFKAAFSGLSGNTTFLKQDLWKCNLNDYDHIVIFGVEQMMGDLEKKFAMELRKDSTIIACRFPLPNVKEYSSVGSGVDTVWIYKNVPNLYWNRVE